MAAQKSILTFFQKSTPVKRALETAANNLNTNAELSDSNKENQIKEEIKTNEIGLKRAKLDTDVEKEALTKENKAESVDLQMKIENNRYEAKMKLVHKDTLGLINNFGISWFKVLEPEFSKPYFKKLAEFVAAERSKFTIYPPENEVFSWTKYCKIDDVKVVILGQDPYHGPNQAHGLCFSVKKGVAAPPSLVNIYKELKNDIDGFAIPQHGTLIGWSTQGVLLLNACLTVRKGEPNSHKDRGWENYTDSVIQAISKQFSNVVFMLWGAYAQKKSILIDSKKHLILNAPHPSPLSASKGWFGSKHFSKANDYLKKNSKAEIDWCYLPTQDEYEKKQAAL